MAIDTQAVIGRMSRADGDPVTEGFVRFILDRYDATDNGVIAASRKIDAEIEADGSIAVDLWPNAAGLRGTFYSVLLLGVHGNELEKFGRIHVGTEGPYKLADLLREEMPPAATSHWSSLTQEEYDAAIAEIDGKLAAADAKVSDATEQAGLAATHKTGAEQARDAAQGHKNAAHGYAQDVASAIVYQNLAGVMASYGLNIVDAFVYDTTKDFMGGLWRYQTSDKSWHDEEGVATGRWLGGPVDLTGAIANGGNEGDYFLHTNGNFYKITDVVSEDMESVYRGSRREFPANAIITAEGERVVIWDGDDPSLPMWRIFRSVSGTAPQFWRGGRNATSVTALNGSIVVGLNIGAEDSSSGLLQIELAADRLSRREGTLHHGYETVASDGLGAVLGTVGSGIVSTRVNDVAITTLPGAPIDPETGMPIPTIAVATDGGVSVIRDDGRVVDVTFNSPYQMVSEVSFTPEGHLATLSDSSNTVGRMVHVYHQYDTDILGETSSSKGNSDEFYMTDDWGFGTDIVLDTSGFRKNLLAYPGGLALDTFRIHRDPQNPAKGLHTDIRSNYATGWMLDPKGCWLASTDASDLVGSGELLNAATATDDSIGASSIATPDAETIDFTVVGGDIASAIVSITTTAGQAYAITTNESAGAVTLRIGTTPGGSQIFASSINGTEHRQFVALSNQTYLTFASSVDGSQVTDISVKRADEDRSVANRGLIVSGTVARTPVAPGAELVGYSGFSATNYLEQPYNPDLDFGTGDFCVMGWVKRTAAGYVLERAKPDRSGIGFSVQVKGDGNLRGTVSSVFDLDGTTPLAASAWGFFVFQRVSGVFQIYLNGVLLNSIANNSNLTGVDNVLSVGANTNRSSILGGSLALLRIGATAPTPEQIAKIYRDEKKLFQPGTQCTLYGSSDAVTALAHDEDKGLLLAGTSGGLSRFDGLLRVSHKDTPVLNTIACGAGYEVTQ